MLRVPTSMDILTVGPNSLTTSVMPPYWFASAVWHPGRNGQHRTFEDNLPKFGTVDGA